MSHFAHDAVNAKLKPIWRAERQSLAQQNRSRLRSLPGYLPVIRRPKCYHCGKRLPLYPYSSGKARYGWNGNGRFCKLICGYFTGLKTAGGEVR